MLLREKKRYREFNFERFMLSLFLFLMYNNLWSDIMKMNDVDINILSPMMKEYVKTKREYMDVLLFYRLGDFYELFFEDYC